MKKPWAIAFGVLGSALGLILVGWLAFKWAYPCGVRTCALPCMNMSLQVYAWDHDKWYPNAEGEPYLSLSELYPDAQPRVLAGISGDRDRAEELLSNGEPLDSTATSWVYHPGFREDDPPELAIIWERRDGLAFNGRRREKGSHAVGFADGSMRHISAESWPRFLQEQEALRTKVLADRE